MSTQALPGRRALTTSVAAYGALTPSATRPSGDGVIDLTSLGVPDLFILQPFATGGDGKTFTVRAVGWRLYGDVWQKMTLGEWDCTTSSACGGVAGSSTQSDTEYMADTIVATSAHTANEGVGFVTVSPADDTPGSITIDRKGCPIVQVQAKVTSATKANAVYVEV